MQHFDSHCSLAVGQTVKYFSHDLGEWVTANVHSFNPDGTMNLSDRRVEAVRRLVTTRVPQVWTDCTRSQQRMLSSHPIDV